MQNISVKDRQIIREIAKKQFEYAKSPDMQKLKYEWFLHNTFNGDRPMVYIELDTFVQEIIPPLLKCEGKKAREIEASLYNNYINHELFKDDFVVKDYYPVSYGAYIKLFDIDIKVEHAESGIGHHFVPIINDLNEDFKKFGKSKFIVDKIKTQKDIDLLNDLFGDILPVKLTGQGLYAVPTQQVVHFMGMENMFMSMYDYPDEFKKMMDMIADEYISFFDFLKDNQLILPTTSDERVAQGSWCFTDELPGMDELEKRSFGSKDVWGFLDSQETVGISTDMFEEFIFPCYKKIAEKFGMLSYGCCEPVDPIWDKCISGLDNLRKVSISPWCNEGFMGEKLRGRKTIYQRKPSPNYLGVDETLDEDAFVKHIDKTLASASGCKLEITQRDVYTVNNNPDKVRRYVEIIRQRCEKNWR